MNPIPRNLRLCAVLIALTLVLGCEDVIDLNLQRVEPRLVIEGFFSQDQYGAYFRLSRTTDFYSTGEFEPVAGAVIEVEDDAGHRFQFDEFSPDPGRYLNDQLFGEGGRTYKATVTVEGKTYRATTTMPPPLVIDSFLFEYQSGGGIGLYENEGYRPHVYFHDNRGIPDYARIRLYWFGEQLRNFYLYDGKYSDGNDINYEYFFDVYQEKDQGTIELLSMDRAMYDYFLTLSEVAALEEGQDPFDVTPSNPNTNWDNGALGYFGAFFVSRRSFILNF